MRVFFKVKKAPFDQRAVIGQDLVNFEARKSSGVLRRRCATEYPAR